MTENYYTEEELRQYFDDPDARRAGQEPPKRPRRGLRGYFYGRFKDPRKAQAAFVLTLILIPLVAGTLLVAGYLVTLSDDLPSLEQIENPNLQLATIAYAADGETEIARYFFQNRSWVEYENISPHVINALIATEDRRFYDHWGVDVYGIFAAIGDIITEFDLRGASTITQQLARNLYQEVGRETTIGRKLREMVTAVELERRYTKREIIEMYLNTVEYVHQAHGIEAAARTFFSTSAAELDPAQAAVLVGMLQNPSLYNPTRFPENAQRRRNTVLALMVQAGTLDPAVYEAVADEPVELQFQSSEITQSEAPYFAEHVRNWLRRWSEESRVNMYQEGLRVYTTLDLEMQDLAQAAVDDQMEGLQAVVDYEWSARSIGRLSDRTERYEEVMAAGDREPFAYFWQAKRDARGRLLLDRFVQESARFKSLRDEGLDADEALAQLKADEAFMDSLKTTKSRIEAGLVSIDPQTGHIKTWVGGRDLATDWNDHVAGTRRQPGSTFKPFAYTAAIDNGYSPDFQLPNEPLECTIPETGEVWAPRNFGGGDGGGQISLNEALATSNNLVTARIVCQDPAVGGGLVSPEQVAFYARRMGVQSPLDEVPALALGVSDVSLLEMVTAYATLADGGAYKEPVAVLRIEDRTGNVLYEAQPERRFALDENTAYTVINMMRGGVDYGTAVRLRGQYGLREYDLAAKTGTTQNNADGWFMLLHPELVTGAWVGFNDRRVAFRTNWWGQGAHNAMYVVGEFMQRLDQTPDVRLDREVSFPLPQGYERADDGYVERAPRPRRGDDAEDRRVDW